MLEEEIDRRIGGRHLMVRSVALTLLLGLIAPSVQAAQNTPPEAGSPAAEERPSSTLLYVSDYFSFVGADEHGNVSFALDNNRGQDGEAFQAEHFVVLHDERDGWMEVSGNGPYENVNKELFRIPDSSSFQFEGAPETGLTITSAANQLTLRIDPIPRRHHRAHEGARVWMGSASAVLKWRDRTIPGRVIYESLMMPDFNRLTRTYVGMWKAFQGLYLLVDTTGDFYAHSQQSDRLTLLVGKLAGFAVLDGHTHTLDDLTFVELNHDMAWGFYRWPSVWRITWQGVKGPATMALQLSERKEIKNWVIGGFSMGIIRGDLTYDGRTWPVYGLVELIM